MSLVLTQPPPPRSPHHLPISRSSTPCSSGAASQPCTPPLRAANGVPPYTSLHAIPSLNSTQTVNQTGTSPAEPLSAPSTPLTTKHHPHFSELSSTGMERCKSSEPAYNHPVFSLANHTGRLGRDRSRARDVKATTLKFKSVPSSDDIRHLETVSQPSSPTILKEPLLGKSNLEATPSTASAHLETPIPELGPALPPPHIADTTHAEDQDEPMDVDEPPLQPQPLVVEYTGTNPSYSNTVEDGQAVEDELLEEAEPHKIWGMPKWGVDDRQEVRDGVRLLDAEELPDLVDQHSILDTPSHVLFPWLHGISDDGKRGTAMAAFFGLYPPFEPPSYRGLTVLFASNKVMGSQKKSPSPPPQRPDLPHREEAQVAQVAPTQHASDPNSSNSSTESSTASTQSNGDSRTRSETVSTSTGSYVSSNGTTEGTSPSIGGDFKDSPLSSSPTPLPTIAAEGADLRMTEEPVTADVEMHPCEPKRANSDAAEKDRQQSTSIPRDDGFPTVTIDEASDKDAGSPVEETEEDWTWNGPHCFLLSALLVEEVFEDVGSLKLDHNARPKFRAPRLPRNINLRNLNIQPVKYATISDIVLYTKGGANDGVLDLAEEIARAQADLYKERMEEYYQHVQHGEGEGLNRPIKYGVWVVKEPFTKIEQIAYHLVNVTSTGEGASHPYYMDVFDRENRESRYMTRATEVVEGFWVGNDADVPDAQPEDGIQPRVHFDLCVRASEMGGTFSTNDLKRAHEKILEFDEDYNEEPPRQSDFNPSPATIALRNLLTPNSTLNGPSSSGPSSGFATGTKRTASPNLSMKEGRNTRSQPKRARFVSLSVSAFSRSIYGAFRNGVTKEMVDRVVEIVYWLRKVIERRDGSRGTRNRQVLIHCQDGYTESSIIVLAYIMSSLSISLPEAYLHLQNTAQRSFFLYSGDKPLLKKVDERFAADRKAKALKLLSQTNLPTYNSTPTSGQGSRHHRAASTGATSRIPPPSAASGHARDTSTPTNSNRWKNWSLPFGKSDPTTAASEPDSNSGSGSSSGRAVKGGNHAAAHTEEDEKRTTVEIAKKMLEEEERGGRESANAAKVWFEDRRFDGFPSRIVPFLYLGNLEHAGNAAMLQALSITHVVSVGESLINCAPDTDPMYGPIGENCLRNASHSGKIKVLDLTDVRDDGNDPLRPIIARACAWIEAARLEGGKVLVHCRVGVSRSASIVMAYMMQYHRLGLMDAYLVTRARRLNVLIQPNLRFYHELFGWEVELAKREMEEGTYADWPPEADGYGPRSEEPMSLPVVVGRRRILYSWPAFCRELYYLNRRFLCN